MSHTFQAPTGRLGGVLKAGAVLCALLSGAAPACAQSNPAKPPLPQVRMDDAARTLGGGGRLKLESEQNRRELVDFVAGNILFVLLHEMAHVHVSEMGLPVLGREEDAADAYATITMLKMGSDFSYGVLVQAAKGWFLSAERGEKAGELLMFYDEHGLDRQRAYQIVCLMVGSDPDKFGALADYVKMPDARQESCQGDYSNASWSWEQALKPHRRTADQPKTRVETAYGDGEGNLDVNARSFRAMHLLEIVAARASEDFVWRKPFKIEMQTCGRSDARWDLLSRRLVICYELVEEFVQLFRDAMVAPIARVPGNEPVAHNIKSLRLRDVVAKADLAADATPARTAAAKEGDAESAQTFKLEEIAYVLNTQSLKFYAPPSQLADRLRAAGVRQAQR